MSKKDYFELWTKKEILDKKLFGLGNPAPGVLDSFGDFLAIATREYGIFGSKETIQFGKPFKGHHAGGTDAERLIDIAIVKATK